MPVKTFSITKGERLHIDLPSVERITRKRGEAVDIVGSFSDESESFSRGRFGLLWDALGFEVVCVCGGGGDDKK